MPLSSAAAQSSSSTGPARISSTSSINVSCTNATSSIRSTWVVGASACSTGSRCSICSPSMAASACWAGLLSSASSPDCLSHFLLFAILAFDHQGLVPRIALHLPRSVRQVLAEHLLDEVTRLEGFEDARQHGIVGFGVFAAQDWWRSEELLEFSKVCGVWRFL